MMDCEWCGAALTEDWEIRGRLCRRCQWSTPDARRTLDALKGVFGPYKKVVEMETGVARAVPVEAIVVEGVKGSELGRFEIWDEAKHGRAP